MILVLEVASFCRVIFVLVSLYNQYNKCTPCIIENSKILFILATNILIQKILKNSTCLDIANLNTPFDYNIFMNPTIICPSTTCSFVSLFNVSWFSRLFFLLGMKGMKCLLDNSCIFNFNNCCYNNIIDLRFE